MTVFLDLVRLSAAQYCRLWWIWERHAYARHVCRSTPIEAGPLWRWRKSPACWRDECRRMYGMQTGWCRVIFIDRTCRGGRDSLSNRKEDKECLHITISFNFLIREKIPGENSLGSSKVLNITSITTPILNSIAVVLSPSYSLNSNHLPHPEMSLVPLGSGYSWQHVMHSFWPSQVVMT